MKNAKLVATVVSGVLGLACGYALAADPVKVQKQQQDKTQLQSQIQEQDQEQIFGRELMSKEEMDEYQLRMRKAKSLEEKEMLRNQHRERMLVRAKERGVTLPEEPPYGAGPGTANTDPGGKGKGKGDGRAPGGGQGGSNKGGNSNSGGNGGGSGGGHR